MNRYLKYIGADVLAFILGYWGLHIPRMLFKGWISNLKLEPDLDMYIWAPLLLVSLFLAQWLMSFAVTKQAFPRQWIIHGKVWALPLMFFVLYLLDKYLYMTTVKKIAASGSSDFSTVEWHFYVLPLLFLLHLISQILLSIRWVHATKDHVPTPAPPAL